MSDTLPPEKKLKVVSLEPKIVVVNNNNSEIESSQSDEDSVILASFLINQEDMIEDYCEKSPTFF